MECVSSHCTDWNRNGICIYTGLGMRVFVFLLFDIHIHILTASPFVAFTVLPELLLYILYCSLQVYRFIFWTLRDLLPLLLPFFFLDSFLMHHLYTVHFILRMYVYVCVCVIGFWVLLLLLKLETSVIVVVILSWVCGACIYSLSNVRWVFGD